MRAPCSSGCQATSSPKKRQQSSNRPRRACREAPGTDGSCRMGLLYFLKKVREVLPVLTSAWAMRRGGQRLPPVKARATRGTTTHTLSIAAAGGVAPDSGSSGWHGGAVDGGLGGWRVCRGWWRRHIANGSGLKMSCGNMRNRLSLHVTATCHVSDATVFEVFASSE